MFLCFKSVLKGADLKQSLKASHSWYPHNVARISKINHK